MLVLLGASGADAQRLRWHPEWREPNAVEVVLSASFALGSGLGLLLQNDAPRWTRVGRFDERLGAALSAGRGAQTAGRFSDVLAYLLLAQPVLVHPLIALGHDAEVAAQMSAVSALALTSLSLTLTWLKQLTARERPARACRTDRARCGTSWRARSFPSGHAATAFAAASLACAFHGHLQVLGDRRADAMACGVGIGLATATGLLRVAYGVHHVTDVIVGALLGFVLGWVVPSAVYFGFGVRQRE